MPNRIQRQQQKTNSKKGEIKNISAAFIAQNTPAIWEKDIFSS